MKKLLILTFALLVSLSVFGRPMKVNPKVVDKAVTDWVLDQLRDMGYTILPEVIVQDTLNRQKQRFSSRYETKGGRGYLLPEWANDSTWYPGQKPPKKEWDDLYYTPSQDGRKTKPRHRDNIDQIVDTLVKENPNIEVNNYYNEDPFFYSNHLSMFYHGGFNYWHYNPFFYDPWYDDFGWGWNSYYGYNYPYGIYGYPYYNNFYFGYNNYWGWNFGWNWSWNWYHPYYQPYYHNNYYGHNGGGYGYHNNYNVGRRERPSNYTQTNLPSNRRFENTQGQRNRIETPQNRPQYSQSRRSYTPSYENPRMGVRPNYNNSHINNMNRNTESMNRNRGNMGSNMGNMNRNTENRNRNMNMPNGRRESTTQTHTYTPSTNRQYSTPSRSYSQPSNSFNSGSGMDRRSSGSSFSNSYNSGGGASRSSSGSSSSGSSNNSGGHSSGRR